MKLDATARWNSHHVDAEDVLRLPRYSGGRSLRNAQMGTDWDGRGLWVGPGAEKLFRAKNECQCGVFAVTTIRGEGA